MKSVLIQETPVNDVRLARCQHPRLRQALTFQHPSANREIAAPSTLKARKPARFRLAEKSEQRGRVATLKGAVAVVYVKMMTFMFDGFQFVTTPL